MNILNNQHNTMSNTYLMILDGLFKGQPCHEEWEIEADCVATALPKANRALKFSGITDVSSFVLKFKS